MYRRKHLQKAIIWQRCLFHANQRHPGRSAAEALAIKCPEGYPLYLKPVNKQFLMLK